MMRRKKRRERIALRSRTEHLRVEDGLEHDPAPALVLQAHELLRVAALLVAAVVEVLVEAREAHRVAVEELGHRGVDIAHVQLRWRRNNNQATHAALHSRRSCHCE